MPSAASTWPFSPVEILAGQCKTERPFRLPVRRCTLVMRVSSGKKLHVHLTASAGTPKRTDREPSSAHSASDPNRRGNQLERPTALVTAASRVARGPPLVSTSVLISLSPDSSPVPLFM